MQEPAGMTGKVERKSGTLRVAVGYALLSVLLWLAGWLVAGGVFYRGLLVTFGTIFILGPLGFAFHLGVGATNAGLDAPWVFATTGMVVSWVCLYLVASALLALCLRMRRARSRSVRAMAIALAVLVWLASGFADVVVLGSGGSNLPVR
jgi:hypothetical protein